MQPGEWTCGSNMGRLKALPSRLAAAAPRLRQAPKFVERFYSSPEWRALVARRRLDSDYFAARRRAKKGERLILDHTVERRDGGDNLDPSNTQWLTMSEHQTKTAKARGARARGEVGGGSKV
jgi:5-methylcytosine-specific restriction protein A